MLRADDVMERFELLAELTPEEAERYRVLCADAALHVKNMLQHEAPEEEDRSEFEREITAEVQKAYTPRPDGSIIFRFPRLFFTATKQ